MKVAIRPYAAADWPALWPLLKATIATGEVYAYAPDTPEEAMREAWCGKSATVFVALDEGGALLGSYFLRPNQPGLGNHVANGGYVVAPAAFGRGIATSMCEHSIRTARELGYRAMQFNYVISTNTRAVALWQRFGFAIVGTLPGAFRHATRGYVDAHVMYRSLD